MPEGRNRAFHTKHLGARDCLGYGHRISEKKNPAVVAFGRLEERRKTRTEKLSAERRKGIARDAAKAR
jgi:hypothetical protein